TREAEAHIVDPEQRHLPSRYRDQQASGPTGYRSHQRSMLVAPPWGIARVIRIRLAAAVAPSSEQASRAAASTSPTIDSGSRRRFHFNSVAMVSTPRTTPVVSPLR